MAKPNYQYEKRAKELAKKKKKEEKLRRKQENAQRGTSGDGMDEIEPGEPSGETAGEAEGQGQQGAAQA